MKFFNKLHVMERLQDLRIRIEQSSSSMHRKRISEEINDQMQGNGEHTVCKIS